MSLPRRDLDRTLYQAPSRAVDQAAHTHAQPCQLRLADLLALCGCVSCQCRLDKSIGGDARQLRPRVLYRLLEYVGFHARWSSPVNLLGDCKHNPGTAALRDISHYIGHSVLGKHAFGRVFGRKLCRSLRRSSI